MGANFDVTAILKANVSDFKSGLKEAQASLVSLKNQTGSSLEKLSGSINTVGDSMMKVGAGMTAGFTLPVAGAVGGVIKSFANLEQALGGVETLFKDSAGTVIKNSETAYKRAGISGVKYMEQVTSFSASLLQGLGGDTVQASKYADMAIVDMADNANKFGTNIQDIQNAYQGFAKDNYTMLDNLKLGYGGTQEEMARLVNESGVMGDSFKATAQNVKDIPFDKLIQAIHVTQERMGITGTTAKEASETVAGSFESMKASAQDLVAGLGQKNADIKTLMENLKESIITFKDNIVRVLKTIWDNLPLEPWQKWIGAIVISAGPVLTVVGTITKVVGGIVGIVSKVSSGVSALIAGFQGATASGTAISGVFGSIGSAIGAITGPIWVVIGLVALFVAGLVGLYKSSEEFRDKVNSAFQTVSKTISGAITEVVNFVKKIFGTLVSWWNENHALILQTAETIWNAIKAVVETVVNAVAPIIEAGWNAIVPIVTTVWDLVKNVIETGLNVILGIIKLIMQIINGDWSGAWETIKEIVNTIWEGIKTAIGIAIQGLISIIQTGLEFLKEIWTAIWNVIMAVIGPIWDFICNLVQTSIQLVSDVINNTLTFISDLWNTIWNTISGVASTIWNTIYETISNFINSVWETIQNVLNTISETWNNIWNGVKGTAEEIWTNISSFISDTMNGIFSTISEIWNNISSFISDTLNSIFSSVSNVWNDITSSIGNFMNDIFSSIQEGWNNAVSAVQEAGSNIVSAVTDAFSNAISGAKDFVGNAISAGGDLINGFVDGVKNFAGNLINAVGDAIGGAIDWAKNLLGIKSPSRVFKQFGVYTDQGFINGVDSKAENVAKSVGGMAQGAINAFADKDLSGVFQDELSTVEGALGSLTAYDPNINFDGGILTVNQQPADITLKLGSTTYRAFTNDITREQEMELILGSY